VSAASQDPPEARCPVCGEGVLADISYVQEPGGDDEPTQVPESREVQRFSCGHEVVGAALASADAERLEVERRSSEETVEPPD
jgi:hypothetical protein